MLCVAYFDVRPLVYSNAYARVSKLTLLLISFVPKVFKNFFFFFFNNNKKKTLLRHKRKQTAHYLVLNFFNYSKNFEVRNLVLEIMFLH